MHPLSYHHEQTPKSLVQYNQHDTSPAISNNLDHSNYYQNNALNLETSQYKIDNSISEFMNLPNKMTTFGDDMESFATSITGNPNMRNQPYINTRSNRNLHLQDL